jgi:hypothetical protein
VQVTMFGNFYCHERILNSAADIVTQNLVLD